ncbi:MAG: ABC transporter permease, partial [Shewanella sp.]
SALSRQLAFSLDASAGLAIAAQYEDVESGADSLRAGEVYALVVIPARLEQEAVLGRLPTITVLNNGQFILIAKLVNSALAQVVGNLNGQIGVLMALSHGKVASQAAAESVPIQGQISALFNLNSSYAQFLLTALLPATWQIFLVLYGLNALARRDRLAMAWHQQGRWLGLWRVLMPHVLIGWGWGILWCALLFIGLGYPMHGCVWILLLGLALCALAGVSMGAFFYLFAGDATRAISLAGAYTAPSFAFMGVTFPASAMAPFAQFWRTLLPISHYIELQIGQSNYGQGWMAAEPKLLALALFILPLWLLVWRKPYGASSQEEGHE